MNSLPSSSPGGDPATPSGVRRGPEPRLAWAWVAADAVAPRPGLPAGFHRTFTVSERGLSPARPGEACTLAPVVSFVSLSPRARPRAYCPTCLERVTLKLGRVNRPHFAHRPHSACPAARGEGALHLDAKLHLAAELAAAPGTRLSFRRRCWGVGEAGGATCPRSPRESWSVEWDAVAVEMELGGVRPDVVLMRGGAVAGAVEVRSSHAVGASTAARYRELGLAWLEVPARALLPETGGPWSPAEPLEVLSESETHPAGWRCAVCGPRQAALEAMQRDGVRLLAVRPLNLYLRDGGRSAGEVRVRSFSVRAVEGRSGGATVEAWLERSDTRVRIAGPVPAEDPASALAAGHALFRSWAARMRASRGAAVESPTGWHAGAFTGATPQRLRWDSHAERFRGPPNLPAQAWPPQPALADGWEAPHPVLGYARCAWSEVHPRRGVLTHAVAGRWWLTLAVHAWEADRPMCRADVVAWRHTGTRWVAAADASREGPARDWAALLPGLAEEVSRLEEVDRGVLARLLGDAA